MRKTLFTLTMAMCVAAVASVASSIAKNSNNQTATETIVGYIVDKPCSGNKAMLTNKACVQSCVKKGALLVLVEEDGRVYALDQTGQDKAGEFAGEKVKVSGSVSDDSISVTSIERD